MKNYTEILKEQENIKKKLNVKSYTKTIYLNQDGLMKIIKNVKVCYNKDNNLILVDNDHFRQEFKYVNDLLIVETFFNKKKEKESIRTYQYDSEKRIISEYRNGIKSTEYMYNIDGYTKNIYENNKLIMTKKYDNNDLLIKFKNLISKKPSSTYFYNENNKLIRKESAHSITEYKYKDDKIVSIKNTGKLYSDFDYEYINEYIDNKIIETELISNSKREYIFNDNGLLKEMIEYKNDIINKKYTYSYEYHK